MGKTDEAASDEAKSDSLKAELERKKRDGK
jgi:hypothetical protein